MVRFTKRYDELVHRTSTLETKKKILQKEIKEDLKKNGMFYIHGLEESILLRWQFSPN